MGTTNSKPPGPIIMINQSEILSRKQVQIITLVFGGAQLCCTLYQPQQAAWIWCRKSISWAKPAHFDFCTINFTVRIQILSTCGGALSRRYSKRSKPKQAKPSIMGSYEPVPLHYYWFTLAEWWDIIITLWADVLFCEWPHSYWANTTGPLAGTAGSYVL